MAGRPRLYPNAAERTRAYRKREQERTVKMDRVTLQQTQEHLRRLMDAVDRAKEVGDPLARSLKTISSLDLLADLAALFEARGRASE